MIMLTFGTTSIVELIAQTLSGLETPGVAVEVWLSGDKVNGPDGVLPTDGASVVAWKSSISGFGRDYVQNTHTTAGYNMLPTFDRKSNTLMNFQPSLVFGTNYTKLVNASMPFDLTKAYYVFYVSRLTNTAGARVVFSFSANNATTRYNNIGWYGGLPYFTTGSSSTANRRIHQGNGKSYGVNAVTIPNKVGAGLNSYLNGVANTSSFTSGNQVLSTSTSTMSIIGADNYSTSDLFSGEIQELIILSANQGQIIAQADLDKINTYLAIKYAVTKEDGNYLDSSNNVVWDRSVNAGYTKNVFGIGRDSSLGLYQKQATSTDKKELTIYLGDKVADLNVNNTSDLLSEGDYLILGSNGNSTYVPYAYKPGEVTFANNSEVLFDEEINFRKGATFKSQVSGTIIGANGIDINVVSEATYALVSKDPSFIPTNTRIYKIGTNPIHLENGDYLAFALYEGAPGGLKNDLELWLSADFLLGRSANLPTDQSDVTAWSDISGKGRDFIQNGTQTVPRFSYSGINFNPTLDFYQDGEELVAGDLQRKLVSESPFPIDPAKAYYTFWVSSVEDETSGATGVNNTATTNIGVVFATNSTIASNNNNGWSTTRATDTNPVSHIYASTAGYAFTHPVTGMTTAIGAMIRTNTNSTASNLIDAQYVNGIKNSIRGRLITSGSSVAVIGNSTAAGSDNPFFGNLNELIVYSGPVGTSITDTEINKIQSYLALKYGITLPEQNLITSKDVIVWNITKNVGYTNDVFGLGHDKPASLYIKQATSASNSAIVAFVGDDLADINQNNIEGDISDGVFVVFGSNGNADIVDYNYYPEGNPAFLAGVLDTRVNFRTGTVLKTQLTNVSEYTLNISGPGLFVLVSPVDPSFMPENTRIYKVDPTTGNAEITVRDGDYISFAYFAEGPGGVVRGLRMWLDADDLSTMTINDQGQVLAWKDKSNVSNSVYNYDLVKNISGAYPPTYTASSVFTNFYPAVNFYSNSSGTTTGDHIEFLGTRRGPASIAKPDAYTYINVLYTGQAIDQRSYFMGFGALAFTSASRHPVFGFIGDYRPVGVVSRYYEIGGLDYYGSVKLFDPGSTLLNYVMVEKAKSVTFDTNGVLDTRTNSNISTGSGTKLNAAGLLGGGSLSYATLKGVMGQSIYYERVLTAVEKDKVDSYLGLKYATTIRTSGTGKFNYLFSDGTTSVWNGNLAVYSSFHNNVSSIVRDDISRLFNNIARSTEAGAMVTIALRNHKLAMSGQGENTLLPVDLAAITWGNDGADLNSSEKFIPFSSADLEKVCNVATQRTTRSWMIRKTNNLGETELTMYLRNGDFEGFVSSGYQPVLFIADSKEKVASNDFDKMIIGSYDKDLQAHVLYFTLSSEFTYFTLGVKMLPGACETCDFEGGKTINFTSGNWTRGSTANSFNLGPDGLGSSINFTVNVANTIESSSTFYSGYPRVSSASTLRLRRRGNTAPMMQTVITPSTSAAAKFQIFNLDREGQRYKQVEIYGQCVNPNDGTTSIIYPVLTTAATGRNPRSSYSIISNKGIAKRTPTSSYTNNRGRLNVDFEHPVEKIYIKQNAPGTRSGSQDLGIGPITFTCPQPLPSYSEEGLSMVLQATDTVKLCGTTTVEYMFRVYNVNCDRKSISISDTLPENMYWDLDLINIDADAMSHPNFNIAISSGNRVLQIDSLIIPGAAFPYTFKAYVMFTDNAQPGAYENQAWLRTTILKNDVDAEAKPYASADYFRGEGFKSRTIAIDGGMRLKPVTVTETKSNHCYRENNEIQITLTVDNPNSNSISDMIFEVGYNGEFQFVKNSLNSSISSIGSNTNPQFDTDGSTTYPGYFYVEGFVLPIGVSTFSFKVKAPTKANLVQDVDADGNPIDWDGNVLTPPIKADEQAIISFIGDYDFLTEMDDECISSSLIKANGSIEIPYCRSKAFIISNKHHATHKIKK